MSPLVFEASGPKSSDDLHKAHLGFQHHPNRKNSINWIGISPTSEYFGKVTAWFTGTAEGAAFGELYNSVYSCENSFLTYITASSL